MRPLKLTMRAFGPYPAQEIVDFRALEQAPLFLIHGKTGAGKSMLLDAICFALYGVAAAADRNPAQLRSQRAAHDMLTEVALDFRLGDAHYHILRRPTQLRRKKRGDGFTEEKAHAELWRRPAEGDGEDTLLAHSVAEVTAKVEELLGLTAAQFRQVIVLPQGAFRDLLTAGSGERQEILQRLFDTEVHARMEAALKERARAGQERLQRLAAERAALLRPHDLHEQTDDEALAALRDSITEAEAAIAKLEAEIGEIETRLNAAQTLHEARANEQRTMQVHAEALTTLQKAQADAEEAAQRLEAAERQAADIPALRERLHALEQALTDSRQLAAISREVLALQQRLTATRQRATQAEEKSKETEKRLQRLTEELSRLRQLAATAQGHRLELERLREAQQRRRDLAHLEQAIARQQQEAQRREHALESASQALEQAQLSLRTLQQRLRQAHAVLLAHQLRPGEPCPVCGSHEHPAPASGEATGAPSEAELAAAEATLEKAQRNHDAARATLEAAQRTLAETIGKCDSLRATLPFADMPDEELATRLAQAQQALTAAEEADKRAHRLQAELETLQRQLLQWREEARTLTQQRHAQETDLTAKRAEETTLLQRLPEALRDPDAVERQLNAARERLTALEQARQAAEEAHKRAREALSAAQARHELAEREREKAVAATEKALQKFLEIGLPEEQASALPRLLETLRERLATARRETGRLTERREALRQTVTQLEKLRARRQELEEAQQRVHALAALAAGDNPQRLTFQRYVLGALLDEVLAAASHRLLAMTQGRYALRRRREPGDRRRAGGLELDVLDGWSGELRPVQTLSGGESFLAALSLALGLADVVQAGAGGVRMETLFIDEGFGSLDAEALDLAIDALLRLRAAGRLIGIISHVAELRERIPAQLLVEKAANGSRTRFLNV